MDSPKWQSWSGYAFESVCWYHVDCIKKHLGISGVYAEISTWRSKKTTSADGNATSHGAQIDLLIDRKDRVVNLCEMKFSVKPFVITKAYADILRNKIAAFRTETNTPKTTFLTFVAANGLADNEYARQLAHDVVDMDALFSP